MTHFINTATRKWSTYLPLCSQQRLTINQSDYTLQKALACSQPQPNFAEDLEVMAKRAIVRIDCVECLNACIIDNRIRVRRLVGEAMNKDLHMVIWLTEAVLYGVVSLIWEKPPCAFWIRCHWSRLSPSSGGTLGSTWQGMVSQQLATV